MKNLCSECGKEDDIVLRNSQRLCRPCFNFWKQKISKGQHKCPTCPGVTGNKHHPCKECDPIPYTLQSVSSLVAEAALKYNEKNIARAFELGEKAFDKLDEILYRLEDKLIEEEE